MKGVLRWHCHKTYDFCRTNIDGATETNTAAFLLYGLASGRLLL